MAHILQQSLIQQQTVKLETAANIISFAIRAQKVFSVKLQISS